MNSQRGQTSILIIVLLLIAGIFFLQSVKVGTTSSPADVCVIDPIDRTKSIFFQGSNYDLIREASALSQEQFKWHINDSVGTTNYGGSVRKVYKARTLADSREKFKESWKSFPVSPGEDQRPASVTFAGDAKALDLLFIDVSDMQENQVPGYVYVKIFLKRGTPIPDFIKKFCQDGQPVSALKIFPGVDGKRFPPALITKDQLGAGGAGVNGANFTLFAYERVDSEIGKIHRGINPDHPGGQQSGTVEIDGKSYPYGFASFAVYLALFDDNSGYIYLYSKEIPVPSQAPESQIQKTLQLDTFPVSTLFPWGWWSPECKPAIYLYPEKTTDVHVTVKPKGFLTYTDPKYPESGWRAVAEPNGKLTVGDKKYDYLYYEAKIEDSAIEKPTKGFVVSFDELPRLYDEILPKLGLNAQETKDYKEYWEKYLTRAPYYFVGVMSDEAVERIEPLTVSPKPTTIIRVRLYYQALDEKIEVSPPVMRSVKRDGFTVVEWGGLVKNDPNHPFTCSQ